MHLPIRILFSSTSGGYGRLPGLGMDAVQREILNGITNPAVSYHVLQNLGHRLLYMSLTKWTLVVGVLHNSYGSIHIAAHTCVIVNSDGCGRWFGDRLSGGFFLLLRSIGDLLAVLNQGDGLIED